MDEQDINPYSPPSTVSDLQQKTKASETNAKNEKPNTRLAFRTAAVLIALLMIWIGAVALSQFSIRNAIFGISMIVFGCHFAYGAITER